MRIFMIVLSLIIQVVVAFFPHINSIDDYGRFIMHPSLTKHMDDYSRFLNTTMPVNNTIKQYQ